MMLSEIVMLGLQLFCLLEAAIRGQGWKALYWMGAFVLTISITWGMKQ